MRFISRYGKYSVGVRSEVAEVFAQGKRVMVRELEAKFSTRGPTRYERELGLKLLSHHGQLEDRLEGGNIAPLSRISVFDSEKTAKDLRWTEEERELVEQTLLEDPQFNVDFILVEQPKRPAPWNGYDKLEGVDRILAAIDATGVNPGEVLAYELENAKRQEVIEELESLLSTDVEQDVVIEAN